MNTVSLEIATRNGCLFTGDITKVTCPTTSGYITVLPNHVALVSVLSSGIIVVVTSSGDTKEFPAKKGVIEIRPNHVAMMLHE